MKNNKLNILVTNDDGISAKGIRFLIDAVKEFGNITVVAPEGPQSAKSHSITQATTVSYKKIVTSQNYSEYSCSGTPVDCVKIAIHEILKQKPDLIVSGINHGSNTSVSVIYSGTMAAAVEAGLNGIPGIGFSVCSYDTEADFSAALPYVKKIINEVITNGLPQGTALNVNFPDLEKFKLKGIKIARGVKGTWKEKFLSASNPYNKNVFWISGEFINFEPEAKDTDEYAVNNGYVSVVPVKFDFNNYEFIGEMKKWNLDSEEKSDFIANR